MSLLECGHEPIRCGEVVRVPTKVTDARCEVALPMELSCEVLDRWVSGRWDGRQDDRPKFGLLIVSEGAVVTTATIVACREECHRRVFSTTDCGVVCVPSSCSRRVVEVCEEGERSDRAMRYGASSLCWMRRAKSRARLSRRSATPLPRFVLRLCGGMVVSRVDHRVEE